MDGVTIEKIAAAALEDALPKVELIPTSRKDGSNKNVAWNVSGGVYETVQFVSRQNCETG